MAAVVLTLAGNARALNVVGSTVIHTASERAARVQWQTSVEELPDVSIYLITWYFISCVRPRARLTVPLLLLVLLLLAGDTDYTSICAMLCRHDADVGTGHQPF
jgi:hypothetical protein